MSCCMSTKCYNFRQYQCPLLPLEKRPPKPKSRKSLVSKLDTPSTSGTSSSYTANPSLRLSGKNRIDIPNSDSDNEDIREHKVSSIGKPKGLIDGLSMFFTPSDKRKSRVSVNTRIVAPVFKRTKMTKSSVIKSSGSSKSSQLHSNSQQAASRLVKKSKLLQQHRDCKRRTGRPPGSGQLKGLFDGLSHIFAAQGDRKKACVLYAPPKRMYRVKLDSEAYSELPMYSSSVFVPVSHGRGQCRGGRGGFHPFAIHSPAGRGRGRGLEQAEGRSRSVSPGAGARRGRGLSSGSTPSGRGRGCGRGGAEGKNPC